MKKGQYFSVKALSDGKAEIFIDGDIVHDDWRYYDSETSAVSFRNALNELGDVSYLDVHINSGGGDVFEAAAIYNMLKRHKAQVTVYIDGLAASAASVIAMAGDKIVMPANSMMMIHNAWGIGVGNHNDFRKIAEDLEKINNSTVKQSYLSKNADLDEAELSRLMNEETWLSANEALEMGLADEVIAAVQVAASISDEVAARYKNVPSALTHEDPKGPSATVTIDAAAITEALAPLKAEIEALKNQMQSNLEPQHTEPKEPTGLMKAFMNLN